VTEPACDAAHPPLKISEAWGMPAGFFLLSDERQRSTAWTIRDAGLLESAAPQELRWFAQRP
jgi:hypothetical protein